VIVSGLFCVRQTTQALAEQLAEHFSVINYDRRGRGDSGDLPPYAVEREIDDLAALIEAAGGWAFVYGHSSGAGLALNAAAAALPITRLVLHEPPYGPADEKSMQTARDMAEAIRSAVEEDRRDDAIRLFFADSGMPPEMIEGMSTDPAMQAVAPTMPYDFAIMGDSSGATLPEDLVRRIGIPTLVIAGEASEEFFRKTSERIVAILPNGKHVVLEGQDHAAPAAAVAPVVAEFLGTSSLDAV
jgi:pimeloyl-ACP methyl ester carboxylesterase